MKNSNKISVNYLVNNIEQFNWFKNSVSILLRKNANANINIYYDPNDACSFKQLLQFSSYHKSISLFDYSAIVPNFLIDKPMICWLYILYKHSEDDIFIMLDNDTFPNIDIQIFNNIFEHSDKYILQRPSVVHKDDIMSTMKSKLSMHFKVNKKHWNKIGNGGVVIIETKRFKNTFNNILLNKDITIEKLFLEYCIDSEFVLNTKYYSDEFFLFLYFHEFINNDLPINFNASHFLDINKIDEIMKMENFILHWFIGSGENKIKLYSLNNMNSKEIKEFKLNNAELAKKYYRLLCDNGLKSVEKFLSKDDEIIEYFNYLVDKLVNFYS